MSEDLVSILSQYLRCKLFYCAGPNRNASCEFLLCMRTVSGCTMANWMHNAPVCNRGKFEETIWTPLNSCPAKTLIRLTKAWVTSESSTLRTWTHRWHPSACLTASSSLSWPRHPVCLQQGGSWWRGESRPRKWQDPRNRTPEKLLLTN